MLLFDTAIGTCAVRWSDAGITHVFLPGGRGLGGMPRGDSSEAPESVRDAIEGMIALLDGEHRELTQVVLDERDVDEFQRQVYVATRAIGPGATASYGEVARAIGQPGAARAIGAALGRNPFPIVVPCHRVLAADGALTGFSSPGGISTKRRMLEIENAPGFRQSALFV